MSKTRVHPCQKQALILIKVQALSALFAAAMAFIYTGDSRLAVSLVLGGFACVLPNLFFALVLFNQTATHKAKHFLRAFYLGELGKVLLTVAMLLGFILLFNVSVPALVFAFIITHQIFWLAPLFMKPQVRSKAA